MPRHKKHRSDPGGFSRVTTDMQTSAAFKSLTASALRVLLWCIWKNYKSATASRLPHGPPTFKLTNREARSELDLTAETFSRAKKELEQKGFLEWVTHGGLLGCNGVASEYRLSGRWKQWEPPPKKKRSMEAARKAAMARGLRVSMSLDRGNAESSQAALAGVKGLDARPVKHHGQVPVKLP